MASSVGPRRPGSRGVVGLAVLALSTAAAGPALAQTDVTFTKDVLPILQNSCQTCHREGAIAPRGNPADMPPPRAFADRDKWHIGEPDWIVPIPEPFVVPADGANCCRRAR